MKRHGPDSLSSWIIAVACCFINMIMYGMARLSGVLLVASVDRFQVPREKASFPYTFDHFLRNFSGPLVGYMGHRFGVRSVTAFGALLGATGIAACYFAENINTVTVLWGVMWGLGFGFGSILLPVSINQYFDEKRATASGISFSGACLGSFILPPVVELLLNTYGLSGTYLFLSGFVLNCVPAALLLKKPNFEINAAQHNQDIEKSERSSIVSGMKVKLYTVENETRKSLDKARDTLSLADIETSKSALTYEERLRGLSTQTLVSEYGVHMSTSEPLNVDEIIENSKGRRQVDQSVLEAEVLSISSISTTQDLNSEGDEVFEKETGSSSVQNDSRIPIENPSRNRTLSADSIKNSFRTKYLAVGKQNYSYEKDLDEYETTNGSIPSSIPQNDIAKRSFSQTVHDKDVYFNSFHIGTNNLNYLPEKIKISKIPSVSENYDSSVDNFKVRHGKLDPYSQNDISGKIESSSWGSFSIIFDPMFILITITNAIYNSTFVCVFTIIVDFSRDLNIGESNEKYILMAVSVGDLIGRLGLGWITDGGYMTTTGYTALLFACQGLAIAAIPFSDGLITLLTFGTLYGLTEAGLIVIFPIIIAQYIDHDKQTVAIPSSSFLAGPLCLAIPPLIGIFRDRLGAYDWLFYLVAILSFLCCFSWMLAPCIARYQKKRKNITQKLTG